MIDIRRQVKFHTIIGVALVLYWIAILVVPETAILSLLSDDAFYYFKIAQNIVSGNGSTFDGIEPTNGYHPLWMLVIVSLYSIGWTHASTPVLVIVMFNGLMAAVTFGGIYRLVERHLAPGYGAIGVAIATLPLIITALTNGMETSLLIPTTICLLNLAYDRRWTRVDALPRSLFAYGAGAGLLFICRLDSIFIAFAASSLLMLGALVNRGMLLTVIKQLFAFFSGFSLLSAPYIAWNFLTFGHWTPISGSIKSTAPILQPDLNLHGDMPFGALLLLLDLVLVTTVIGAQIQRERSLRPALESPLVMLALACVAHFVHAFLFLDWGVYWWHFTLYGILATLAFPPALMLACRAISGSERFTVSVTVIVLAALAVGAKTLELENKAHRHRIWKQAAVWATNNLESDAIIALTDAGLFGYFAKQRVINLDGKANGYIYREHLARADVREYLERLGVGYIADSGCQDPDKFCWMSIPRAGKRALLMKADSGDLVFRSEPYPHRVFSSPGQPHVHFVIWKFRTYGQ